MAERRLQRVQKKRQPGGVQEIHTAYAGMELLTTASDADARQIIKQLGWDRCRDELDIMPKFAFSRRYPRSEYR